MNPWVAGAQFLRAGSVDDYVVSRSVTHGRRVGLASVAGVHVGTVVHVVAAAAALSALLVSSAAAFTAVKYAGAAYLVVLGLRRLLAPQSSAMVPAAASPTAGPSPRHALAQGVVGAACVAGRVRRQSRLRLGERLAGLVFVRLWVVAALTPRHVPDGA